MMATEHLIILHTVFHTLFSTHCFPHPWWHPCLKVSITALYPH